MNNPAVTRDRLWRETKVELLAARAKITCLHGQLSRAPAIQERAFTYGHGAGVLSLRDRLLATPDMNLASMDLRLFSFRFVVFCQVDTYGSDGMLDAFLDVPLTAT